MFLCEMCPPIPRQYTHPALDPAWDAIQPTYGTVQRDIPLVAFAPQDPVGYSASYMPPHLARDFPVVAGRSAVGGPDMSESVGPISAYGASLVELPDVDRVYLFLLLRRLQLHCIDAGGTAPVSRGLGGYHFDADELAILSLVSLFRIPWILSAPYNFLYFL